MYDIRLVHSAGIERVVLGCLIMQPERIKQARQIVTGEDFYYRADKTIFNSLCEMDAQGLTIDLVFVCHFLEQRGVLDEVGGATYIASLVDALPKAEIKNVPFYCHELHLLKLLRDIQKQAYRIVISEDRYSLIENTQIIRGKIEETLNFYDDKNKKASNEGLNEKAVGCQ
jgi:replicative DNA helicase